MEEETKPKILVVDDEEDLCEILKIRHCIDSVAERQGRRVILKVIIETGVLVSPENIAKASFLAMESGADFIKTSTGKSSVHATLTQKSSTRWLSWSLPSSTGMRTTRALATMQYSQTSAGLLGSLYSNLSLAT